MDPLLRLLVVLAIIFLLLVAARYKNLFDADGLVAAFAVGLIIGWFGDLSWLVVLLAFMFTGIAATKYKFNVKKQMGVQEGMRGERGWHNVVATGAVPAAVAAMSWNFPGIDWMPLLPKSTAAVMFISVVGVAAADTLASELGVFSDKVYLITNGKPVPVGTNGGISWYGQAWAFVASTYVAIAGYLVMYLFLGEPPYSLIMIFIPMIVGFVGCQIDSVLGATIEGKYIGKHEVNILSIAAGGIIAWLLIL